MWPNPRWVKWGEWVCVPRHNNVRSRPRCWQHVRAIRWRWSKWHVSQILISNPVIRYHGGNICNMIIMTWSSNSHRISNVHLMRPEIKWALSVERDTGIRRPAIAQMYLYKLQNVFVQIAKCICPNCKMYLSKFLNVFVQIAKCICPNSKLYLSKLYKSNGHCLERVSDSDAWYWDKARNCTNSGPIPVSLRMIASLSNCDRGHLMHFGQEMLHNNIINIYSQFVITKKGSRVV